MEDSKRLGDVQVLAYELDSVLRGTMTGDPLALVAKISALTAPSATSADAGQTDEDRAYTAGENVGRAEGRAEAVAWLRGHADIIDADLGGCDGVDAERFALCASDIRHAADQMEKWAKGGAQ